MTHRRSHRTIRALVMALTAGVSCGVADAAVTLLGVQYQQDNPYTEYQCIWHDRNYPTDCGAVVGGSNVHVYLRNDGASSVTINDVTLAGYSLKTVIKRSATYHNANSIYFYWDNPPQAIIDAGEPVWYKGDPTTIPPGGVAQAVVRLRYVPVTRPVSIGVVTSAGTVSASVPVDSAAPQLASVGFSQDRTKVYLHWRRSGGAAPTTIRMDGNDVTANTTTVGDPSVNFAESVLTLGTALPQGSYHVYQGVYADGKTATASLRTWGHEFIHATWYTFPIADGDYDGARAWIDEATNHGINAVENQMPSALAHYLDTSGGAAYARARGFGTISWSAPVGFEPWMWFLDDEPDAEEDNLDCGTGLKLPCGSGHDTGVLAMLNIEKGEDWRRYVSTIPTSVNMDGTLKPDNYYSYGQAVDCLQVDPYYQARLRDSYYDYPQRIPLYAKATYIYAVSLATTTAAEPNPSHVILYSCKQTDASGGWPYPTRESKRIEFYYALAAGAKGISYWWFKTPNGLGTKEPDALAMWYEVGLLGNEVKTISPLLVTSHPVAMTLTPSAGVWARALASGTDTIILLAVNDDYYNDPAGCHYTPKTNASVVAALPTWMQSSPTAFEIRPSGLYDVATSLSGGNLTVSLGTLNLTRMIVITTNPQLRATIQQRYEEKVRPGICAFAPEYCVPQNNPPSILQHPVDQTVDPGGSAAFTVVAAGSSPLSYQWQKNQVNLSNGGHYSGCTTATLTVSSADSGDAASYRCVVTNPYGTATSNAATLTLAAPGPPAITQQPSSQSVVPGGTAVFTVAASGTPPLSYQWQKNQVNLSNGGHYSGCTTATLTVSAADSGDAGNYRCIVTNGYGSATSSEASLTVTSCSTPMLINGGFEGGNTGGVAAGWTAYSRPTVPSFIAYTIQTASPAEGLQYQQIQSSYVASGGAGVYQVVTGCTPGATYTIAGWFRTNSASGRATVKCAPDGSTSYNSAIDLNPAASTTSSAWVSFSGTVVASASSITIFLDGQTHVVVTGDGKAAAFDGITVTCVGPAAPTITQQPAAQSVCPGGTATFTVAAAGDGPLQYQWQKNGANVSNGGHYSGATTATLTITGTDGTDAAAYRCVVSNAGGNATSNAATLTIRAPTQITQQPTAQQVCPGGAVVFTVAATGDGSPAYQWQKEETNLSNGGHYSGVNTATLTVTGANGTDVGNYRCVVTAGCGGIASSAALLTLKTPTLITVQPVPQEVPLHGTAVFTVTATGEGVIGYQWRKNGVDLSNTGHYSGVTTDTLTISNADAEDAAGYRCAVTAGCGSAISDEATLTVTEPTFAAADLDRDGDVDLDDFAVFQLCFAGPNRAFRSECDVVDFDRDGDVDLSDFAVFQACFGGPNRPSACP